MSIWAHGCICVWFLQLELENSPCFLFITNREEERSELPKCSDSFIYAYIKNQNSFYNRHKIAVNHLLWSRQEGTCFKTKTTSWTCPQTLFSTQKAPDSNQKTQGFCPASVPVKTGHKDGDWYISTMYPETLLTIFDVNNVHVNYFQYEIFGQYKWFF